MIDSKKRITLNYFLRQCLSKNWSSELKKFKTSKNRLMLAPKKNMEWLYLVAFWFLKKRKSRKKNAAQMHDFVEGASLKI